MDNELFLPSVLFILMGIGGVWLSIFSGIAETFVEMRGFALLLLVIGLILLPASILRGSDRWSKKHSLTIGLVVLVAIGGIGVPIIQGTLQAGEEETFTREVHITMIGAEWAFNGTNPEIRVKVGDKVVITFINEGTVPHDFFIPGLITEEMGWIPPGESGTVSFIARSPGRFDYICSVPGHAELGMRGVLIIEE